MADPSLSTTLPFKSTERSFKDSSGSAIRSLNEATIDMTDSVLVGNSTRDSLPTSGSIVVATNNTIDANRRGIVAGAEADVQLTNNLITYSGVAGVASESGGVITMSFSNSFNPGLLQFRWHDRPDR